MIAKCHIRACSAAVQSTECAVLHPLAPTVTHKALFKLGVGSSDSAGFKASGTTTAGLEKQYVTNLSISNFLAYLKI